MARPESPTEATVYPAECASMLTGQVQFWLPPLTDQEAIDRLRSGGDVVVRGGTTPARRHKARQLVEAAFGAAVYDEAHGGPGNTWTMSLPHFNPPRRLNLKVHAFFEDASTYAGER